MRRPSKTLRRRRWHQLRDQRGRGVFLLPGLLTIANLFCGFYALLLTVTSDSWKRPWPSSWPWSWTCSTAGWRG